MPVAKYDTPRSQSSNFASTTLDNLNNGNTSDFVTYDNSTNLDLYGNVVVKLGTVNPTTGATITLRVYSTANAAADVPDNNGKNVSSSTSTGGGDIYQVPVSTGSSAKVIVIPMVRLYPFSMRMQVTNGLNTAFPASGNTMTVQAYNENVT